MSRWQADLCSDVRPAVLDWLWPGYLPRGKLVLLDGDPEVGKSLLTIDLIARLSRGGPLPDGTPLSRAYTSILLSAEDDAHDTIRPRAEAAGADLSKLVLPRFAGRLPRFPADLPALEELIVERQAALVAVDPLMAFLPPAVAANLDQCVRQVLTPLAQIAGRTGCTIELIRHLVKKWRDRATLRGQGSAGILAAARTALFAGPAPAPVGVPPSGGAFVGVPPSGGGSAPDRLKAELQRRPDRVLAVSKTNVAIRPPALGYRIVSSPAGPPVVEWTGPVDLTADALGERTREAGLRPRERAMDWLRRELAGGPRKAVEVSAAAIAAGIPERTLNRAKKELGVESLRVFFPEIRQMEWYWHDPEAPWPKDPPFRVMPTYSFGKPRR